MTEALIVSDQQMLCQADIGRIVDEVGISPAGNRTICQRHFDDLSFGAFNPTGVAPLRHRIARVEFQQIEDVNRRTTGTDHREILATVTVEVGRYNTGNVGTCKHLSSKAVCSRRSASRTFISVTVCPAGANA